MLGNRFVVVKGFNLDVSGHFRALNSLQGHFQTRSFRDVPPAKSSFRGLDIQFNGPPKLLQAKSVFKLVSVFFVCKFPGKPSFVFS